jgi:hypothetical protein
LLLPLSDLEVPTYGYRQARSRSTVYGRAVVVREIAVNVVVVTALQAEQTGKAKEPEKSEQPGVTVVIRCFFNDVRACVLRCGN